MEIPEKSVKSKLADLSIAHESSEDFGSLFDSMDSKKSNHYAKKMDSLFDQKSQIENKLGQHLLTPNETLIWNKDNNSDSCLISKSNFLKSPIQLRPKDNQRKQINDHKSKKLKRNSKAQNKKPETGFKKWEGDKMDVYTNYTFKRSIHVEGRLKVRFGEDREVVHYRNSQTQQISQGSDRKKGIFEGLNRYQQKGQMKFKVPKSS